MIKLGLFQGCKDSSIYANQCVIHYINKLKDKNHTIISVRKQQLELDMGCSPKMEEE